MSWGHVTGDRSCEGVPGVSIDHLSSILSSLGVAWSTSEAGETGMAGSEVESSSACRVSCLRIVGCGLESQARRWHHACANSAKVGAAMKNPEMMLKFDALQSRTGRSQGSKSVLTECRTTIGRAETLFD